jgi:hypothetical protein
MFFCNKYTQIKIQIHILLLNFHDQSIMVLLSLANVPKALLSKPINKIKFTNRFYNNLSSFLQMKIQISKNYISKYGEFRIRNPPNPI